MECKFHHNSIQSETINQRYRCKDGYSPNNSRQGERWPLASSTQGCCHPNRPASDDCCLCPLQRTQLSSGKVSSGSSNSSNRTSSSSSSSCRSDKATQNKTTQVFPAILQQYPKIEKKKMPPIPLIISTQPHFQISKR